MPRGKRKTEAEREADRLAKEEEKRRKAQEREEARQRKAAEKEAEKKKKAKDREKANKQKKAEKVAARKKKEEEKRVAEEAKEPKVKWKRSAAKKLLYDDLKDGRVPLDAKDEEGKSTMKLIDIYNMRPEYAKYHYDKFSSRLSSLRKTVKDRNERQALDQEAFENYKANHPQVSYYSRHGYIQWQGSDAQEWLLKDIAEGLHLKEGGKNELWASRPEYYTNFPLKVFRDKLYQEIRTAKYLYTLEEKGKDPRKKHLKDQGRIEKANKDAENDK